MEIETIAHKALRAFAETGKTKGLPGDLIDRLAGMLSFLDAAKDADELLTPPNYGAHILTGNRAGTWSLTVTRNWRMTFKLTDDSKIVDMDLEDYH
jgi:proteic killer suppression protein